MRAPWTTLSPSMAPPRNPYRREQRNSWTMDETELVGSEGTMGLDWFDDGAIQILLPDGLLGEWHGIDSSDYDRACSASGDWLNQLPVGDGIGLVLGGDPGMVLVAPDLEEDAVLVRWVYGD